MIKLKYKILQDDPTRKACPPEKQQSGALHLLDNPC